MSDIALRSLRFREEREASWLELEDLLAKAERGAMTKLSYEEMLTIPSLYRSTLSSLSVARSTSLDAAMIDYLEALCARSYFFVYGTRATLAERIGQFFARSWPLGVRSLWRETLAAILITAVSAVGAFYLVQADSSFYHSFVPQELAGGRDPNASAEELRATLYQDVDTDDALTLFATFLFTHNSQVAILAFALGIAFCAPSVLLLAYNGCTLGAMFAVFASHGLARELAAWLLVHGVTELFAIILAGAAGLRIGWSAAFPGARTRLAAVEHAGREGGLVMMGVIVMLFLAALLEGFARQLVQDESTRWAVAASTGLIWIIYFYARPGERA
jgi:uncharacterized membrane protein SpoIIM required for sporulation